MNMIEIKYAKEDITKIFEITVNKYCENNVFLNHLNLNNLPNNLKKISVEIGGNLLFWIDRNEIIPEKNLLESFNAKLPVVQYNMLNIRFEYDGEAEDDLVLIIGCEDRFNDEEKFEIPITTRHMLTKDVSPIISSRSIYNMNDEPIDLEYIRSTNGPIDCKVSNGICIFHGLASPMYSF